MALSAAQEGILEELVEEIPDDSEWCIFGSVDFVLRGLDEDPSDIDIVATEDGAEEIREIFSEAFVETRDVGDSQIAEYRIRGEEIEVIYSESGKAHQEPLIDLEAADLETTPDLGVPVAPLKRILPAYEKIDKHDTADKLERRLRRTSDFQP